MTELVPTNQQSSKRSKRKWLAIILVGFFLLGSSLALVIRFGVDRHATWSTEIVFHEENDYYMAIMPYFKSGRGQVANINTCNDTVLNSWKIEGIINFSGNFSKPKGLNLTGNFYNPSVYFNSSSRVICITINEKIDKDINIQPAKEYYFSSNNSTVNIIKWKTESEGFGSS